MLDDEPFQLTPEEIEAISRAVADAIAQNIQTIQNTITNNLHVYEIIPEDKIEELVDLDLIASSVHGITDILGQIAGWFQSVIDNARNLIVSGIQGFINTYVMPAINSIKDWFNRTVPEVGRAFGDLVGIISDKITAPLRSVANFFTVDIPNFFSKVTNFFTKDIPGFFSKVVDFFTRDLPGYFSKVADFFTKELPSRFSTVIDFFTKTLPQHFGSVVDFFTRTLPQHFGMVADFFTKTMPQYFGTVVNFFTKTIPQYFGLVADFFTKTLPQYFGMVADFFTKVLPDRFKMVADFFTNTVPKYFGLVADFFTKTVPQYFGMVADFFTKTVPQYFGLVVDFFTKTVPQFFSMVMDFFTKTVPQYFTLVADFFTKTVPQYFGMVADFFTKMVPQYFGMVVDFFTKTIPQYFGFVADFFTKTIPQYFGMVGTFFTETLPKWIEGMRKGVTDFIDLLMRLPSRAADILMTVGKFLFDTVIDPMIKGINTFIIAPLAGGVERMSGILNSVGAAFQGFMNSILKFPEWFQRNLVEPFLSGLGKIGEWIWNALPGWVKDALNAITNFFTKDLVNFFTKTLPSFFDTLSKGFQDFIRDPLGWFQRNLVDPLVKGLNAIGQWIWNALPDWFKDALTAIQRFFTQDLINFFTKTLPDFFTNLWNGIQDFLKDPLGWFKTHLVDPIIQGFNALGQWIWNALPDWLKEGLEAIGNVFKGIAEGVVNFFKNPWESIRKGFEALWSGIQWLGQKIWEGLQWLGGIIFKGLTAAGEWLWNAIKGGVEWFIKALTDFGTTIVNTITGAVVGGLKAIGESLIKMTVDFVEWLLGASQKCATHVGPAITDLAVALVKPFGVIVPTQLGAPLVALVDEVKLAKNVLQSITSFGKLIVLWGGTIATSQALATGAWAILHGIATPLDKVRIVTPFKIKANAKGKAKAHPAGVGAEGGAEGGVEAGISVPLTINLGLFIRHIAREVRKYADTIGRSLAYGFGIWITQPMVRLASSIFRNMLVVELPTLEMITESLRRHMPHEKFKDLLEKARGYLALYGYSDTVIQWLTSTVEEGELIIKVKDRFGNERIIPLSLMYSLPSASDVARMAIRDIFGMGKEALEEFTKIYYARGMHPDIGVLYYLLHYRYPPPERLWTFVSRGISGLLWATIPGDMMSKISSEAEKIGAGIPTNASYWNFKGKELMTALQTYMTWHDYARFSWIKKELFGWQTDFTSDNQIMIDTLADIPTKIDQRWMVRFGLYQLLSEKGVSYQSEVSEFCKKVVESAPKGKVILDLTNFCRTLQSTGLHPYYVPITAVAETINAITDERTLLRTGVINLYKEGFLDSSAVSRLGQGIVMTSFNVAYFDPGEYVWKTGYINIPLRYLGMEAQLIGLRAIMDRALDILRDIQRDALTAYQEFIITDESEFKAKLSNIINGINSIYEKEYNNIIGESPPEDLKLKYVESYYSAYLKSLEIWREVFTTRRIRMWTQRWLGWVMYRAAYGTVTKEDIQKLVSLMKDYAKLTEKEVQFIQGVLDIMYGMARREVAAEYLPTPSTMATLSEYLTLDTGLVKKILTERGIPEEWQNIWLRYISVKPIKSDAKSLLSAHVRAFRYGAITREALDAFISTLPQYGFTDREIDIIRRTAELEELILEARENRREYLPTPSMLATLSEYVALDPSLIQKVFDARNVPAEWRAIWSQYISVRPIADDVKALLSTYRRVSLYVKIPDEIAKQVLEYAKLIGFTEKELAILDLRNRLEEMLIEYRENRREYIPTPSMLATMSEYTTIPADLIQKVFEARHVPPEWQTIWMQYINIRPIVDDVRGLLSSYRRALIYVTLPDDIKKKVESYANTIGFTQTEWDILTLRVTLEELILEARESRREYIPTPMTLATLCEYLPEAREFFDDVVKARRIPAEWQKLWAKYIDLRPLVDDIKRYLSRAEQLYVRFMIKKDDFMKVLNEVAKNLGYTTTEIDFLLKVTEFERYANAWRELIGTVDRLVELSEYSPRASKYALGKVYEMIDALPLPQADKQELKAMWEEYIKNRPVKSEARLYITQLSNAYAEGLISDADFSRELESMKQWGFSDNEIMFYKARAALMKARKLKLPLMWE